MLRAQTLKERPGALPKVYSVPPNLKLTADCRCMLNFGDACSHHGTTHLCFLLSQTTTNLEGCIYVLHDIHDNEDFIDSLVKVGATTVTLLRPSWIPLSCLLLPSSQPAPSVSAAALSIPVEAEFHSTAQSSAAGGPRAHWLWEGTKPKGHKTVFLRYLVPNPRMINNSTLNHGPWVPVVSHDRCRKRTSSRSRWFPTPTTLLPWR